MCESFSNQEMGWDGNKVKEVSKIEISIVCLKQLDELWRGHTETKRGEQIHRGCHTLPTSHDHMIYIKRKEINFSWQLKGRSTSKGHLCSTISQHPCRIQYCWDSIFDFMSSEFLYDLCFLRQKKDGIWNTSWRFKKNNGASLGNSSVGNVLATQA